MKKKVIILVSVTIVIALFYKGCQMLGPKIESMTIDTMRTGFEQALTEEIHNGKFKKDMLEIFEVQTEVLAAIEAHYETCVKDKYNPLDLSEVQDFKQVFEWIYENIITDIVACTSEKAGIPSPLQGLSITDS